MLATVTSKGQVTLPIDIRKQMGLKKGSRIFFVMDGYKTSIMSEVEYNLQQAQRSAEGLAKKYGIKNEEELIEIIKNSRKQLWE